MPKGKILIAVASYQGLIDSTGKPRCKPFTDSLHASMKLLDKVGYEVAFTAEQCDAYVQHARNTIVRRFRFEDIFMEPASSNDTLVFLDDDLQWDANDLLRLIQTEGEIVAGVYPRKLPDEDYPVAIQCGDDFRPIVRKDGCILASHVPAGFLAIRRSAIDRLCEANKHLGYVNYVNGEPVDGFVDLFPQGVSDGRWWGEDYAFCRLWEKLGGQIWIVPDIWFHHFGRDVHGRKGFYTGNYHEYLMRQPGGAKSKQLVTA